MTTMDSITEAMQPFMDGERNPLSGETPEQLYEDFEVSTGQKAPFSLDEFSQWLETEDAQ